MSLFALPVATTPSHSLTPLTSAATRHGGSRGSPHHAPPPSSLLAHHICTPRYSLRKYPLATFPPHVPSPANTPCASRPPTLRLLLASSPFLTICPVSPAPLAFPLRRTMPKKLGGHSVWGRRGPAQVHKTQRSDISRTEQCHKQMCNHLTLNI